MRTILLKIKPLARKVVKHELVAFLSERATRGESSTATSGLAQHRLAIPTHHNRLGVTEHSRNVEATLALHIHDERVGELRARAA